VLARALAVPLHYEPEKLFYAPDQIPAQWLDPAGVRTRMAWRRYVDRERCRVIFTTDLSEITVKIFLITISYLCGLGASVFRVNQF